MAHRRNASILREDWAFAPPDPNAAATTRDATPSAPSRRACAAPDAATTRRTRVAAAWDPGGYPPSVSLGSHAMSTSVEESRGHRATAVAASALCLAAPASIARAGATLAGCRPTSSKYRSLGSKPTRSAEAVGSAAWAVARERLCCAADAEEEAPSSLSPDAIRSVASSAGSGITVPSAASSIRPLAVSHANGANVAPHPPERQSGAVAAVIGDASGGAHSSASYHSAAADASTALCWLSVSAADAVTSPVLLLRAPKLPLASKLPPAPAATPSSFGPPTHTIAASAFAAADAAGRCASSSALRSVSTALLSTSACSHTSCHATPAGRGGGRDVGSEGGPPVVP